MSEQKDNCDTESKNEELNPADSWHTADYPMTGPQERYLRVLCETAGEEFNPKLTKAQASKKIEELVRKTRRS